MTMLVRKSGSQNNPVIESEIIEDLANESSIQTVDFLKVFSKTHSKELENGIDPKTSGQTSEKTPKHITNDSDDRSGVVVNAVIPQFVPVVANVTKSATQENERIQRSGDPKRETLFTRTEHLQQLSDKVSTDTQTSSAPDRLENNLLHSKVQQSIHRHPHSQKKISEDNPIPQKPVEPNEIKDHAAQLTSIVSQKNQAISSTQSEPTNLFEMPSINLQLRGKSESATALEKENRFSVSSPSGEEKSNGMRTAIEEKSMETLKNAEKDSSVQRKNIPSETSAVTQAEIFASMGRNDSRTDSGLTDNKQGRREKNEGISANNVQVQERPAATDFLRTTIPVVESARPDQLSISEKILEQAVTLRRSGVDSMAAIIKPDRNTELSLQMKVRDGIVEIIAQVNRGDSLNLQAHWIELQTSLAKQGIRLDQLVLPTSEEHMSQMRHERFSSTADQSYRDQLPSNEATDFISLPRKRTSTAPSTWSNTTKKTEQRWERWA